MVRGGDDSDGESNDGADGHKNDGDDVDGCLNSVKSCFKNKKIVLENFNYQISLSEENQHICISLKF